MIVNKNIFLPFLASLIALLCKFLLYKVGYQKFTVAGMPSGHAATFGALLTYLIMT